MFSCDMLPPLLARVDSKYVKFRATDPPKNAILDIDYHLQSASRAFFANKWIFLSRNVSITNKLKFFNAIVTPIACFGAGPPTLTLTLRLHVRRQPSLGRRQCETKTSASGAKLYKIITQLHPQRRILGKVIPLAPLLKSRECHKLASPIMAWVSPSSCTSRIPK